jgi:hypothetical protein
VASGRTAGNKIKTTFDKRKPGLLLVLSGLLAAVQAGQQPAANVAHVRGTLGTVQ